jgi:hypothetical protein
MSPNGEAAAYETVSEMVDGAGLLEDSLAIVAAADSTDWAGGLAAAVSAGFNVHDLVQDPMAKLISMGLGWVIEFFEPLNAWLDWLTGDKDQIGAMAKTWSGIATDLQEVGHDLERYCRTDTAQWSGQAVSQYRTFCTDRANLYYAASGAATATANLVFTNGVILNAVRSIVRDLITDCVGKVICIVLRYPPPATPAASGEVFLQIEKTGSRIIGWVDKLKTAFQNAADLMARASVIFSEVAKQLGKLTKDLWKVELVETAKGGSKILQGTEDASSVEHPLIERAQQEQAAVRSDADFPRISGTLDDPDDSGSR